MIRVVVSGAAGRMGRRLLELVQQDPETMLAAALESPGHPALGQTVASLGVESSPAKGGEVRLTAEWTADVPSDVVIDFSVPAQTIELAERAGARGCAIVVGTTGLDGGQKKRLEAVASRTAVLTAPNFSVGMNVVFRMVAEAGRLLGPGYDVEIVESHHRFKRDAPSGSALRLAERVAEATGRDLGRTGVYGRHGLTGERTPTEIGVHALRRGDVVGEHSVTFTTLGETIEIAHRAHSRDAFALGAIRAAKWLGGRPPGAYTFEQVLGFPG